MSLQEIPAFSIWKTLHEMIPALTNGRPSEKSAEHLAKIIKSSDFSNVFVYLKEPSMSFKDYELVLDKYKAFTTWFLGRFFYLLSCKRLNKSHHIYVDIQLFVLNQLSDSQLHVYDVMAKEYCRALNLLTKFIKSGHDEFVLNSFVPMKHSDLDSTLSLEPNPIQLGKNGSDEFLINVLKIIGFILNASFDFHCYDTVTNQCLDDFLFLLSESKFVVKMEILKIYLSIVDKIDSNSYHEFNVLSKMEFFAQYFEQIIYNVYSKKLPTEDLKIFEKLLLKFLEINLENDKFLSISDHLLSARLEVPLSNNLKRFCKKKRKIPLYKIEDFDSYMTENVKKFNDSAICGLKQHILNDIQKFRNAREGAQEIKIYNFNSGKWKTFYFILVNTLDNLDCTKNCQISQMLEFLQELSILLAEIRIELHKLKIVFIEEDFIILKLVTLLNRHLSFCEVENCHSIFDLFLNFSVFATNLERYFEIFTCFEENMRPPTINNTFPDLGKYKKEMSEFFQHSRRILDRETAFDYLNRFMQIVSTGFYQLQVTDMELTYMRLAKELKLPTLKNLPHLLTVFNNCDLLISEILIAQMSSNNVATLKEVAKILPSIICISSSNFVKLTQVQFGDRVKVEIFCEKCQSNEIEKNKNIGSTITFRKIDLDMSTLSGAILKNVLKFLTMNDSELKVAALEVLPYISNHILKFFSGNVAKIWVEKAGDDDESVRRKFGEVTAKIIRHAQNNTVLSDSVKNEIVDVLYEKLLKLTLKSLEETNIPLQETILDAVFEISEVGHERTVLPTIRIFIYLVMVPTSRRSLVAVNRLFQFAKSHNFTPNQLYKQYKREICELISHLCIVNNVLDTKLSTSLCKISVTLGFYSAKDFLSRECQQLLPYFVVRVLKEPHVGKLLDEMATMLNVTLAELLTNIYGSIFLYAFLNQSKDDFKHILKYLETTTGQPSATLRKRNLWVILNELLLNFHEKRDKVLLALDYLAKLDSEGKVEIREYLSSRLLGLLQHFDLKLMGNNTNRKCWILRSLADFFVFMGPNYIGPLRFKIIAMLRTVDCEALPDLKCEVWDAFIKSCDIESLAPQLATIFVSLLPLIVTCPKKINEIFKYLLANHEESTRDFIKDLFFVDDTKVDPSVLQTIRKHVKAFEDYPLKIKMANYLKYLNHETVEVRIRSLKQLKVLMEKNREELDQMILGYNGIDCVIVELIEILTLGCRDKDSSFKLACGEVIGELGAVEPSHLPRKYAQNNKNFPFFITDDSFVVQSLNELTKALQGEKNTVNMDRFALAIQEILKNYEISSDQTSARNDLWRQFPESQQMLMSPLLTSRYIVSQPQEVVFPVPLFGSEQGDNCQKWLYNWSRSLISTLPQDHQIVLHPCLPAMKQDYRILMQFLPHVLLHSVISDVNDNRERAFLEIQAVISSERRTDDNCLSQLKATEEHRDKIQCTKVVFIILDFLERWSREWQWTNGVQGRHDANFIKIKSFLNRFSKLELARCNFCCGEYPRALLLLEDHITSSPHNIFDQLMFLTRVYAQLDEPDGVAGVTTLQTSEPPIEQRILSLEVSGKLSDAAACYERLPPPLKLEHFKGLIQCYLDLDNVNTALNLAKGAQNPENPIDFGNMLLEMQAEPLWRLGRYDDLDTLLNQSQLEENTSWGVQIGKSLLAFQNGDRQRFKSLIQTLKRQQTELLGATTLEEGAYQHGYEYIARLHSLNELEQVEKIAHSIICKPGDNITLIKNLRKEWDLRIKVVQKSLKIIEPVLCLRRVAIEQAKRVVPHAAPSLDSLLGECWLMSAKTAREVGVHQQSYTYALKAEEFAPPMLFVEKSKLHWMREEHEQALTALRRGLETLLPDGSKEALASLSLEKRKICAEAKLLIASYNDKVSNVDTDVKTANYKEAIEMFREWETGFVHIAQFFDRLFQGLSDEERDAKGSDRQIWIINYFCKSLRYGTKFVYQSLPRLLSIWFDYGTRISEVANSGVREERKNKLIQMTKLIDDALQNLPAYVFLTAFSQIISRICHPQKEVYKELKSIIIKVLQHYPQQSLWTLISVIKSAYAARAKRCNEILNDPQLKTPSMLKLVKDFTSLAEKLIELCDKSIPVTVEVTTISNLMRSLPRLLSKGDFSEIMIPTHKFRKLVLPNPDFTTGEHNPFPNHYVHIVGVEEEVTIMRSLQRPRKITFRGSDGKGYIQMLKPKDDLRKDFRLMEFNDIVNQLLSRESESRQRRLNIRLYSVSPLNEECGLIEWIPNLLGLRQILLNIYKQQGKGMTIKEIKETSCTIRDPLTKKRDVFNKILLPKHPPVLGEWFRRTFPDAQSWYFARTAYIRTTAVISMVGYILGLGDRHGENILLDSVCGDTVHVDFNCLFNKGETLEWPERVPFRLTQNMVAAMGPLGVEGVFRKSCACTLKILRTNADTLMSIVTPFVYDPLVSWNGNSGNTIACTLEKTNEQAMEHVNNIKLRLDGIIVKPRSRAPSIPLSVEGQTNSLINEAMSIDNLCQMYIGWGAYL